MNEEIRLAIADDHALFRRGLANILRTYPGIQVIIEAQDGQDLLNQMALSVPDVVLLDLQMPVLDGIKTTEQLKQHHPSVKIIIISMHDEDGFVTHLMELGANGYLVKDSDPDEVALAVQTVVREDYYYGAFLTKVMHRRMVERTRPKKPSFSHLTQLSDREVEVLQLICEGLTNAQIAGKLFLSDRTVEGHRTRIMEKIGAKNTAAMVVYAVKNGIF
ncbi:response regulator transcription factor [Siphonobacter aquaeclarae]|uniref:Two component transcriptional regulator, LuxR family n=1 Tax=Siphonobacter aquaeclarae TaxID=563176 RepID=A0A1G9NKC1_9BACT|nr:response regulator transcription factor [Siphonobacter aquaeclarae]MBO9636631.1 response regulator transcription factor [Siphonobacter aquaeclarae]SDL86763.1 two component transcriptional regulator, LuxR family [Siphonobacter aquaeclarae]